MAENDLEIQLKIWKDLAVSKQILMRTATDALKLDPECSQEELKEALDGAIKRSIEADVDIRTAREQASTAVSTMEKKLADAEKARNIAEAARSAAEAEQEKMQRNIADERVNIANENKKLKERLAEKERSLKAINSALGDTPDNVLKKMKALKKQKMDESNLRKQADETMVGLRKDKQKLEQEAKEFETVRENAAKLATQHRELHGVCESLREQLLPLAEDADSVPAVPTLDVAILETLESTDEEETDDKKGKGKGKR